MISSNSYDKIDMEYLLAPTDDDILEVRDQRSRSQQAIEVKSYEHYISQSNLIISKKLTGNNHYPPLMTWLDVGCQRSRSLLGLNIW